MTGKERLCVFKPEYVKQILVSNNHKYYRPGVVKDVIPSLGNGLFTSNGKEHAWQRKMIHPAFSYGVIKAFVPVFDKNTDILLEVSLLVCHLLSQCH